MLTRALRLAASAVGTLACFACGTRSSSDADGDVALSGATLGRAATPEPQDAVVQSAQRAIEAGHPWTATRLLAPLMADPRRRTPDAILMAARAAAGWGGWGEVDTLLVAEPWLDSRFDGAGRELLARSALGQDRAADAVEHGKAALAAAQSDEHRSLRSVLLARALDRARQDDRAAELYVSAATTLNPLAPIRDWLVLRAAGSTASAEARSRLYGSVRSAVARPRIPWTEAQTLERFDDAAAAADRYASLGDQASAARNRLTVARDSADRERAKTNAVAFVRTHAGTVDARQIVVALDAAFPSLTTAEELVVARGVATIVPSRAVGGFERARAGTPLIDADQMSYADALARVGRTRDAIAALTLVRAPPRLAAQAAYQRARLTLADAGAAAARPLLRQVVDRHPGDTAMAGNALYLLADLYTDDGDDVRAGTTYRELYRRFPSSGRADEARFHAAIIDIAAGKSRVAALELDSLLAIYPTSGEMAAARYWSGRAWKSAGDTSKAHGRWRAIIAAEPLSYYAMNAARRLDQTGWVAPPIGVDAQRVAGVDSAFVRVTLLQRVGMDVEARLELDALDSLAIASRTLAPAIARGLLDAGEVMRAVRLGQRLLQGDASDGRAYRLAFPLVDREELERAARAHGLDPAMVAGLIRQESMFNPRAVSPAGARGLMQVMPPVGETLARSAAFPTYSPALLFDPDANLQLGTSHLAAAVRRYPDLARVLAGYNAGQARVARWSTKAGTNDPELFTERIPFVETRDYVRIVLRNAAIYRTLYDLK